MTSSRSTATRKCQRSTRASKSKWSELTEHLFDAGLIYRPTGASQPPNDSARASRNPPPCAPVAEAHRYWYKGKSGRIGTDSCLNVEKVTRSGKRMAVQIYSMTSIADAI